MAVSLAYRSLSVADPAASAHFYGGLGFREVTDPGARRGGSPETMLLCNRHGVMLRLVGEVAPAGHNRRQRRPMTALGLTHLNFYVRDFAATLDTVRDRGGAVAEETLIANSGDGSSMKMIYGPLWCRRLFVRHHGYRS